MKFFTNTILNTVYLMFLSVVDSIKIWVLNVSILSLGEGSFQVITSVIYLVYTFITFMILPM